MSSTTINIGISGESKSSSRVLKPPGGGHTDIFAPPEEQIVKQRPKHNQQNSAMMSEIMGKAAGANGNAENGAKEAASTVASCGDAPAPVVPSKAVEPPKAASENGSRARVPPGGFSSGLW